MEGAGSRRCRWRRCARSSPSCNCTDGVTAYSSPRLMVEVGEDRQTTSTHKRDTRAVREAAPMLCHCVYEAALSVFTSCPASTISISSHSLVTRYSTTSVTLSTFYKMQLALSILAAGLVGMTAAAPLPDKDDISTGYSNNQEVISYVTKFDNIQNAGLLADLPVRGVTSLGPYNSLDFLHLNVINVGEGAVGLIPQSAPNVLAYDVIAAAQGPQTITSVFDDSIVDYWNFKSFFFGCVLASQETVASVPDTCTIQITGYKNEVQVASQKATFTADGLEDQMHQVFLNNDFENIDTVEFDTVGLLDSTLDAVLFDNLCYDVYIVEGESCDTCSD
ncbi:hypothetical protein BAUCODRAFT_512714 [Baudoinia panamericana UAMH 10762]|uniref:Uncharacterized protein n=1 Tax=Baudoinia panamericana (strain UAMH 10762) TaxID=717646 RepID=M2NAZ1_BAUPA|nr:uncharacterized protein BAUCODRAFT_512714 [Baudoinia panamericana UAMH 10762]EMC95995.1 hypothetical protein BAUCODRAFT_512714 [Baudoinia panamericana UAMH 10762]